MIRTIETPILAAEERLRLAMLRSDVNALDELIAPELVFTSHLGQVFSKWEDLAAHQTGVLRFTELTPSEQHVHFHPGVAIVSVRMHLAGSYDGARFEGDFRYSRVWALSTYGTWWVIAGHASAIPALSVPAD
jgi:ketosteroid isomerase-like protein